MGALGKGNSEEAAQNGGPSRKGGIEEAVKAAPVFLKGRFKAVHAGSMFAVPLVAYFLHAVHTLGDLAETLVVAADGAPDVGSGGRLFLLCGHGAIIAYRDGAILWA